MSERERTEKECENMTPLSRRRRRREKEEYVTVIIIIIRRRRKRREKQDLQGNYLYGEEKKKTQ